MIGTSIIIIIVSAKWSKSINQASKQKTTADGSTTN